MNKITKKYGKKSRKYYKIGINKIFGGVINKPLFVDLYINNKIYVFLLDKKPVIINRQLSLNMPKFIEKEYHEAKNNYKIKMY
ncbi:MAG: hypothetical protein KC550_06580 [Nanoarchaeota archaeon]|nr:hypothetical protein [Nanoarchaeota archaeon]